MLVRLATFGLASMLGIGLAAAQDSSPPSRIGNVFNGTAHEPNAGAVRANESAAGVAPSTAASRADDNAVQKLNQQIQGSGTQSVGPAKSLACSTLPANCR